MADPSYCCEGVVKTCKGHNASDAYYCRPVSTPMGLCGYTMDGACYGADRGYDYITTSVTEYASVQCDDKWTYSNRYCGTNCTCATGYFDYNTVCTAAGSDVCSELGYTEDSCEGDSIACPYDASAKKCIEAACLYYTEAHCETPTNKICTEDAYGCWNLTQCAEGYSLRSNRCIRNKCLGYILTSCPEGATCNECKSGATTVYKKTGCEDGYYASDDGDSCVSCLDNPVVSSCPSQANVCKEMSNGYCLISCNSGYKVSGNTCVLDFNGSVNLTGDCGLCQQYKCCSDQLCIRGACVSSSSYCSEGQFVMNCTNNTPDLPPSYSAEEGGTNISGCTGHNCSAYWCGSNYGCQSSPIVGVNCESCAGFSIND